MAIKRCSFRRALLKVCIVASAGLLIFRFTDQRVKLPREGSAAAEELGQLIASQYGIPHGQYSGAKYKKILYWTRSKSPKSFPEDFGLGVGRDVYKKAGCPVWQCETSVNRSDVTQYDALLFHYIHFNGSDLPDARSPHQRYVFFDYENPNYHRPPGPFDPSMMNDLFNWTMTYRWDSDVIHPYGWIQPMKDLPMHPDVREVERLTQEAQLINYAKGKTKMAAWTVTNCQYVTSGRNELVNQLIGHGVSIDIYGGCGNFTCGIPSYFNDTFKTDETDEPCRQMMAKTYKFYMALENSLCLDYITEKFWAMMRYPILLVVIDAHGHYAKLSPPHSFINALDFPSARHLAKHLKELDRDDALYNEYFWWRRHYTVRNSLLRHMYYETFCSLCAALHNPPAGSVQKTYKDLMAWWRDQAECKAVHFKDDDIEVNRLP